MCVYVSAERKGCRETKYRIYDDVRTYTYTIYVYEIVQISQQHANMFAADMMTVMWSQVLNPYIFGSFTTECLFVINGKPKGTCRTRAPAPAELSVQGIGLESR